MERCFSACSLLTIVIKVGLRVIACEATEKCACETAINLLTVCEPLRFDADHAVDTSVFRKEVLRGLDAKLPSHAAVLLSLQPPTGRDHSGTHSDRVRGDRTVCMSKSYQLAYSVRTTEI